MRAFRSRRPAIAGARQSGSGCARCCPPAPTRAAPLPDASQSPASPSHASQPLPQSTATPLRQSATSRFEVTHRAGSSQNQTTRRWTQRTGSPQFDGLRHCFLQASARRCQDHVDQLIQRTGSPQVDVLPHCFSQASARLCQDRVVQLTRVHSGRVKNRGRIPHLHRGWSAVLLARLQCVPSRAILPQCCWLRPHLRPVSLQRRPHACVSHSRSFWAAMDLSLLLSTCAASGWLRNLCSLAAPTGHAVQFPGLTETLPSLLSVSMAEGLLREAAVATM
eukprot:2318414-Rhodomonas_salina.5